MSDYEFLGGWKENRDIIFFAICIIAFVGVTVYGTLELVRMFG